MISTATKDLLFCLDAGNNGITKLFLERYFNLKELLNLKIEYYEILLPHRIKSLGNHIECLDQWLLDLINNRIKEIDKETRI